MALPVFTPSISEEMTKLIKAEIEALETKHNVEVLFAIESGSRAWGFPSPDSDYDVRFIYKHPRDWYLSLLPKRDVVELPIDDELDISGWDLRKAMNLLLKPNPVALEWLRSPIRYRWSEQAEQLKEFASRLSPQMACHYHYWHLGEGQWRRTIEGKDKVKLKKYFYALRPALALHWLRTRSSDPLPMNLQEVVTGLEATLDTKFISLLAGLIERKAKTNELGEGDRIPELDEFITNEFQLAERGAKQVDQAKLRPEADKLFLEFVS